jgi:electron-transferring-flavoprotein dehydrogenase
MHYDVVCVGGGPAALSASIRLKQLAKTHGTDISVCVVEKGSEIGAHILSGNVFETKALDELFPTWRSMENRPPLDTEAADDKFLVLTETKSFGIPHFLLPKELNNHGNYIISLSQFVRWLAQQAEELGVEIYPGFAASEVLYDENGAVRGVATRDSGIAKDGRLKDSYTRGVELRAKHTLFAEGARGSCSEEVIAKYKLRQGRDVQTYGIGLKEVWQIPEEKLRSGFVMHTVGWPLQHSPFSDVYGGSFLYHMKPNLIMLGLVVGLDYKNPYLNPYREFQRWKHHPAIAKQLEGGQCISYGARVLNEGGWHAIPNLSMPGASLIGCSAGFVNSVKIKGSHTAMKSGMLAAEALYPKLVANGAEETVVALGEVPSSFQAFEIPEYESSLKFSWIATELKLVRNSHASFHAGLLPGMMHTAFSSFFSKGKEPWTLRSQVKDSDATLEASKCQPIDYPKPDGKISFDLLSNLQKSGE